MLHTVLTNMFQMQLPWLEKILRPMIVYLCLIIFLRVFGKRELAQLNPFDLVVLLSLSNTVQNAIIGNDNSLTGGIVGAFALLTVNWAVMRLLYRHQKLTAAIEGNPTTLIRDGVVDEKALREETLSQVELISVLNKNGFNDPADVQLCILEPNGTFYVKGMTPTTETAQAKELLDEVKKLSAEVRSLREQIEAR